MILRIFKWYIILMVVLGIMAGLFFVGTVVFDRYFYSHDQVRQEISEQTDQLNLVIEQVLLLIEEGNLVKAKSEAIKIQWIPTSLLSEMIFGEMNEDIHVEHYDKVRKDIIKSIEDMEKQVRDIE